MASEFSLGLCLINVYFWNIVLSKIKNEKNLLSNAAPVCIRGNEAKIEICVYSNYCYQNVLVIPNLSL